MMDKKSIDFSPMKVDLKKKMKFSAKIIYV